MLANSVQQRMAKGWLWGLGCMAIVACESEPPPQAAAPASGPPPLATSPINSTAGMMPVMTPIESTGATGPASASPMAPIGSPSSPPQAGGVGSSITPAPTAGPMPEPGANPMPEPGASPMGMLDDAGMPMMAPTVMEPVGPRDFEAEGVPVTMDKNVGKGFGVTVASSDRGDGSDCAAFVASFGQDPEENAEYIKIPPDLDMSLFSIYRPEVLEEGKKYPVATWGNGTCSLPEGQGTFLRRVASHGIIVIAAHSRQVGSTQPMGKGVDFLIAANDDPESPYYQKIDVDNIGAFGHSQGSVETARYAGTDRRVKTVVLLNLGTSSTKPYLAISGDRDIAGGIAGYKSAFSRTSATPAGYLWFHDVPGNGLADGHLTLIIEPARVAPFVAAWFRYTLAGDEEAKAFLDAGQCASCGEFEYESKL